MSFLTIVLAILISFFGGVTGAMLGIGGGIIFVPLFRYVLKMNMHQAIGMSLAVIVPTALVGAWQHQVHGYLQWKILLFAAVFSVLGGLVGSLISVNIDVQILRRVFAVFLMIAALKMLF